MVWTEWYFEITKSEELPLRLLHMNKTTNRDKWSIINYINSRYSLFHHLFINISHPFFSCIFSSFRSSIISLFFFLFLYFLLLSPFHLVYPSCFPQSFILHSYFPRSFHSVPFLFPLFPPFPLSPPFSPFPFLSYIFMYFVCTFFSHFSFTVFSLVSFFLLRFSSISFFLDIFLHFLLHFPPISLFYIRFSSIFLLKFLLLFLSPTFSFPSRFSSFYFISFPPIFFPFLSLILSLSASSATAKALPHLFEVRYQEILSSLMHLAALVLLN